MYVVYQKSVDERSFEVFQQAVQVVKNCRSLGARRAVVELHCEQRQHVASIRKPKLRNYHMQGGVRAAELQTADRGEKVETATNTNTLHRQYAVGKIKNTRAFRRNRALHTTRPGGVAARSAADSSQQQYNSFLSMYARAVPVVLRISHDVTLARA